MTGDMSDQERVARQGVTDAIEKLMRLDGDNDGAVLVDWVLVTAATRFGLDSPDGFTATCLYAGPNAAPRYRLRGLLYEGVDSFDSMEDE